MSEGETCEAFLPKGWRSLCLMVAMRRAIVMAHSDRIPSWEGKGATPEHVPQRLSLAGVLFLHCQSGLGKDLSDVHRKNVHEYLS